MAKERIEVELVADDKASSDIREVDRRASDLDGKESTVKVDADTSGFKEGLDELDLPISGMASKLGGLASPAGAVAAIGAGFLLAAENAADAVVEVDNLARLSGDTVEDTSRMASIWKNSGADLKDLADIYLQMSGTLASNAELAAELGVNLDDGATQGQRFEQVNEALGRIPDATQRAIMASQLFGEEGVRQVNDLLGMYPDLEAAKAAVAAQSVFSDSDVTNARDMQANMREMKGTFAAFATNIGTVAIPAVNGLFDGLNKLFEGAETWGEQTRAIFTGLAHGQLQIETDNQKVTRAFEDSEQAAKDFDRSVLDTATTFDEVRAKVLELGESEHTANLIALEWKETHEEAAPAIERSFGKASAAADQYAAELERRGMAVKAELEDQARKVDEVKSRFVALHEQVAGETSVIRLGQGFDDLKTKAVEAFEKAAAGADDATRAQEDLRLAQLGQTDAVLTYIEKLGGIPDETTTAIIALIDQGAYDQADRELHRLTVMREIQLKPVWVASNGVKVSGLNQAAGLTSSPTATGRGAAVPAPVPVGRAARGVPTVAVPITVTPLTPAAAPGPGTVNVFLPRTAAGPDVVTAVQRWYRVNGRRP